MRVTTDVPAAEVTIYALTDPDTGEVRYVGRTVEPAWKRYSQHLLSNEKVSAKGFWIQTLKDHGKVPEDPRSWRIR